ncbi:helix-turn-helix transcriptional regulator [Flavobacterium aestivum]|uniref:helix-turn-helix transcriptional regulator n=1 Tax=Flavobacterium aestivum TaxID=3003257 RepID=UPI002285A7B4|nr:transcriptional regulator [Flavobacterium aestivum]
MNILIGAKLKLLRKQEGLSQEQVGERLHISQSAYARIENGVSSSWAIHLDKISVLYNIKPEDLFKNENTIIRDIDKNKVASSFKNRNLITEKLIEEYQEKIRELKQKIDYLTSK